MLDKQVYVQDKLSDQKLLVMHAAEGNGPVDALVRALRSALLPYYTCLASCQLADYNVRLLDTAGSESVTRVTVEFFDDATGEGV
jgi:2-isopropylmalate synthase